MVPSYNGTTFIIVSEKIPDFLKVSIRSMSRERARSRPFKISRQSRCGVPSQSVRKSLCRDLVLLLLAASDPLAQMTGGYGASVQTRMANWGGKVGEALARSHSLLWKGGEYDT